MYPQRNDMNIQCIRNDTLEILLQSNMDDLKYLNGNAHRCRKFK